MTTRLGILGGMFDPVHNAHIAAARFAVNQLDLHKLHLVPCHVPNHRARAVASANHRIAMLELAIGSESNMIVDPVEVNRRQVSYAVDTLREIRAEAVDASLIFILGMDAFNNLPQWHNFEELLSLCHLLVLARDGNAESASTLEAVNFTRRQVKSAAEMFASATGKIWIAGDFKVDLSSTQVREAIQQSRNLSTLLNARVIGYINQHNLYA